MKSQSHTASWHLTTFSSFQDHNYETICQPHSDSIPYTFQYHIYTMLTCPSTHSGKQRIPSTTIHTFRCCQHPASIPGNTSSCWVLSQGPGMNRWDQYYKRVYLLGPKVLKPRNPLHGKTLHTRSSQSPQHIWQQFPNPQHTMELEKRSTILSNREMRQ